MFRKGWRNLIVAKCYSEGGGVLYASSMRTFHPKHLSERWGVLISCINDVLDRQEPFVMFWDEQKISGGPVKRAQQVPAGNGQEADDADTKEAKEEVQFASAFIKCRAAWVYSQMFLMVHFLVVAIEDFCESCPCHRDVERMLAGPRKRFAWSRANLQSLWRARKQGKFRHCPLKGRVVGEVAAQALLKLFNEGKSMAITELLHICSSLTSADDRNKVMMDFERGCQHIYYVLTLKLAHWQDNPWRLLALAHPLIEVAREQCKVAYVKSQAATSDLQRAAEHRLTQLLCYPGGFLHEQFMCFLDGDELEALDLLYSRWLSFWTSIR